MLRFALAATSVLVTCLSFSCKTANSKAQDAVASSTASASLANSDDVAGNTINWEHVSVDQLPQAGDYTPTLCARENIQNCIPPATGQNGMTHDLDGIWWMDGNPLADTCVSVGHAVYDPNKRTAISAVFDNDNFTFHGDDSGLALWQSALNVHLVYETDFEADLKSAQTFPIIYIAGVPVRVPEWIAKFKMVWQQDGLWIRQSWFFGQRVVDYRFTRIIKADGTPDHNPNLAAPYQDPYQRYINNTTANQYVIRRNQSAPTSPN